MLRVVRASGVGVQVSMEAELVSPGPWTLNIKNLNPKLVITAQGRYTFESKTT